VALVVLYVLLAVGSATQSYLLRVETAPGEPPSTKYNNYLIFKQSHFHLLEGVNLYAAYPYQHADLYKYSPAFALFFGAFAWLPDWAGLPLWNLLNVAVFLLAIRLLPVKDWKTKSLILLLAAVETMTSLQNSQSNVLIAGLLILGFALFEKNHYFFATLCLVATFYIKIFGIAALIILLFYPEKRKSILYAAFWFVLLWFLPAVATGFKPLFTVYRQYAVLLQSDHSVSMGLSVAGWIRSWFGLSLPTTALALAGFGLTVLPMVRLRNFGAFPHRILLFSALLVWMVIFNHKAESPTFIIAVAGVLLWYFSRERTVVNTVLLGLVVVFTSLAPTDLFPFAVRTNLFEPYAVKAVPCILAWIAMVASMVPYPNRMQI
jgi:hypothetical protein